MSVSTRKEAKPVTQTDRIEASSYLSVEQKLRQVNDDWVQALVRRDTDLMSRLMAEDFVSIFPFDGDGKEQFISDLATGDLTVEKLTRDNVDIRIFDKTAVVSALDNAQWRYKGHQILGYYRILQVYVERQGEWELVCLQACPVVS
jgi:hypothetical protein